MNQRDLKVICSKMCTKLQDSFAPWNVKKQGEQVVKKVKSRMNIFFGNLKLKVGICCGCILVVVIIILVLKFTTHFF